MVVEGLRFGSRWSSLSFGSRLEANGYRPGFFLLGRYREEMEEEVGVGVEEEGTWGTSRDEKE